MSGLEHCRDKLQSWLANVAAADKVEIESARPLTGGAIQENWRVECVIVGGPHSGRQGFVIRSDASSSVDSSLSRSEEFKILGVAHSAGVTVPEPLWLCEDMEVMGRVFYVMRLVEGIGLGPRIVKDLQLGGDREALVEQLGRELARIHSIRPPHDDLEFLRRPDNHPALEMIARLRQHLDTLGEDRPMLEWGLRWAELNLPPNPEITLVHQDFRTGNYLVDENGLTAIDYEAGSGRSIDDQAVTFWEVVAHIRWGVIALQQAHRHLSGGQQSLELALSGRLLPELEFEVLNMTSPTAWRAA